MLILQVEGGELVVGVHERLLGAARSVKDHRGVSPMNKERKSQPCPEVIWELRGKEFWSVSFSGRVA